MSTFDYLVWPSLLIQMIMEGTDAQPIGVDTPYINPCCELTVYRELEHTLLASDELPGASPLCKDENG